MTESLRPEPVDLVAPERCNDDKWDVNPFATLCRNELLRYHVPSDQVTPELYRADGVRVLNRNGDVLAMCEHDVFALCVAAALNNFTKGVL